MRDFLIDKYGKMNYNNCINSFLGEIIMKTKMYAAAFSAVMAAAAVMPCASAASTQEDALHLVKSLTTAGTMTAADDYNQDGTVNAVDLTLLKRELLTAADDTGELKAQTITEITENTKLIGRTLTQDGVTWLPMSGSAVECTVTGTEASVTLAGDGNVYNDAKYRPRYGVYVDGELIADVLMDAPEQTVELFSGTTARTATVKVMHLSEANNGAVGVKQFDVTSAAAKPVKPTAKKDLMIEFIGDSITCAYGVGADNQYVGFETGTEDFSKSYAYLTAGLLDADYSTACYSGYGIISGYSDDGSANTDSLVPPVYESVAKPKNYAVSWDFDANPSDVVVLNLGTNDNTYVSKEPEKRGLEYQAGYVDFLKQIRACNPDAAIICTVGIMGCTELYPYIEAAVAEFGDENVFCYQSPTHNITEDGIGADWHPSAKTHQLNAYLLADKICTAIGRPYGRIGVDFAADGEYGAEIDSTNGANAWPYYAEWNKSLNLNITAGGKSPEEITAYVRGLELPEGGYELAFKVKGAEDLEIPYAVRNMADASKVYCMGSMTGSSAVIPFEMSKADSACEIVFLLGDVGSANVTFENVTLYKRS